MGSGGHNRKSATQAKLDGTFKPSRHVDPVVIVPGVVEPPAALQGDALDAWRRYIAPRAELGFYEPAEAGSLAFWCITLVRVLAANEATPTAGIYETEDVYGQQEFKPHPGLAAMTKMMGEFRALSARLGLDPLSRMALADLGKPIGGGAQLPQDAPPAFKPTLVQPDPRDTFECEGCGKVSKRKSSRGPKPKRCEACKRK